MDYHIVLRAGTFRRNVRATAKGAMRSISIEECVAATSSGEVQKAAGDAYQRAISVGITEIAAGQELWKEEPDKIGSFPHDFEWCSLCLPPSAFDTVWRAVEADDDARRLIQFSLKDPQGQGMRYWIITEASFSEQFLTREVEYDEKYKQTAIKKRPNPIHAELIALRGHAKAAAWAIVALLAAIAFKV